MYVTLSFLIVMTGGLKGSNKFVKRRTSNSRGKILRSRNIEDKNEFVN